MEIGKDQVRIIAEGEAITEASDLQWAPGEWPEVVRFDGLVYLYSEEITHGIGPEQELQAVVYVSPDFKKKLTVLND